MAREGEMTARALHTFDWTMAGNKKENLYLVTVNYDSVSVTFAKLSDMHHLLRITKKMDELEVSRKVKKRECNGT
jgi:hypothetical protein